MYTIFDIEKLDETNEEKLESTILLYNNGELQDCALFSSDELGKYSKTLLVMTTDDLYKYLDNIHYGETNINYDEIPRLLHIYQLVANKAYEDKLKFYYDDAFREYLATLSDDILQKAANLAEDLYNEPSSIYYVELVGRNYDEYIAEIRQSYNNKSTFYQHMSRMYGFYKQIFIYKLAYERGDDDIVEIIKNRHLSKQLLVLFNPSYENVQLYLNMSEDKLKMAFYLIVDMTAAITGYDHVYRASPDQLDKLLKSLIEYSIDCDQILTYLKSNPNQFQKDQSVELLFGLSRVCGSRFVLNKLTESIALIQTPRKELSKIYEY